MFSLAVRTLALPPAEQKSIYPPFADITFELVDDFDNATITGEWKEFEATLDDAHREPILALKQAIEQLTDLDWEYDEDNIEAVLTRPAWMSIREKARGVLRALDIPIGQVPRCIEDEPGTQHYSRRPELSGRAAITSGNK